MLQHEISESMDRALGTLRPTEHRKCPRYDEVMNPCLPCPKSHRTSFRYFEAFLNHFGPMWIRDGLLLLLLYSLSDNWPKHPVKFMEILRKDNPFLLCLNHDGEIFFNLRNKEVSSNPLAMHDPDFCIFSIGTLQKLLSAQEAFQKDGFRVSYEE